VAQYPTTPRGIVERASSAQNNPHNLKFLNINASTVPESKFTPEKTVAQLVSPETQIQEIDKKDGHGDQTRSMFISYEKPIRKIYSCPIFVNEHIENKKRRASSYTK